MDSAAEPTAFAWHRIDSKVRVSLFVQTIEKVLLCCFTYKYSVSASGTLASPGSRRCTNPNEPAPAGEHHAAVQDRTAEIAGGHRAAVQDRTAEMSDESNGLPGLSLDEEWMPDPSGTGWLSRRGDLWSGDVVAGLPFGDGAMTFADSLVLVNGRIVMQSLRTDHRSFKGQCSVKWPTGSSFAGMVSGSFFEGQGTFCGANGDRYTGEWIHSRRHGRGTLWSTDAVQLDLPASSSRAKMMRYEGEWVENMMHGNGVIEYFGDIDDEIVENPVVRRFVGRFFKGFPTEGSLQNTREIFDNVCFDGATHAGDFAVWYWAGDSSGDAHMSPQNPNTLMHLSESGEEYRMAEAQIRKSLSASDLPIQSIQRVQNDELRICYDMQRRSLIKKVEARSKDLARSSWDPHTMERWAFHAPGRDMSVPEPWECIVTEGFQATLAGSQNGRAFGAGIYFAKDASMANGYAKRACSRMTAGTFRRQNHTPSPANTSAGGVRIEKDSNREDSNRELTCRMFLSRIVTGVFTNGNSRMNQPPIDPDGATGEHFHSLVDNVMEPRIFVINDNTRAYPGYLITYKLQGRLEIDEGASVLARPNKYFKLQHGGLSQAHSTALPRGLNREAAELDVALPLHRSLLPRGLNREAAEFEREKACPTYHNATDNQGVMAKVRLCARIACCRCTEGRSLQT